MYLQMNWMYRQTQSGRKVGGNFPAASSPVGHANGWFYNLHDKMGCNIYKTDSKDFTHTSKCKCALKRQAEGKLFLKKDYIENSR